MSIGYKNLSINQDYDEHYGMIDSISAAIHETYVLSYMTIDVLGITLKNLILPDTPEDHEIAKSMISGPIGMGSAMVSLVDVGISWKMIWMIIAFISINLGVINLLPFPALDGGRVVSTTIKSLLSYTPLDQRHFSRIENMFNMVGMIFLLSLSLLIAFFDVTKML